MSAEQLPVKAAPTARKAPPQVPTVPTAGQPEVGLHVAVQQFLAVVRAGRRGGWRAWEPLAAQIDMEDRTALMEFVAVMSMVPPANAPTAGQIQEHMSTIFPARAATATSQSQEAVPTAAAPTIPAKAYPGAPPSAWAGQVQWQPPTPRSAAAGTDPTTVSGTTFLDTPSGTPTPTRATTASFLGAEPTNRPFFNLSAMEAESALPSGASTPAPRMVAQHSVDEAGVRTRLPPEGAVHPLSRRQSRPASPSTKAGAAEQRAAAQDTGATSPTTCGANGGRV